MTIKQIAEKYGLKNYIVYEATVGVKPVASIWRDKDFIEEEVMKNVKANLEAKIRKAEMKAEAARETLAMISEIEENDFQCDRCQEYDCQGCKC